MIEFGSGDGAVECGSREFGMELELLVVGKGDEGGDDEDETVLVEAVRDLDPPTWNSQVPGAARGSGSCRQSPRQGRTLIVYGPCDLGLQGGTARMSSLRVRGRLVEPRRWATRTPGLTPMDVRSKE